MGWLQLVNGWSVSIVLGVAAALVCFLFAVVWKKAPPHGNVARRVWGGARKAPAAAWTATSVVVVCLVAGIVTSAALWGDTKAEVASSPIPIPAVSPSPTPVETSRMEVGGWGPARDVTTVATRPKSAMMNSLIDHPVFGDERNFMRIRLADTDDATFKDSIVAVPGKVYEVIVAVNNDAATEGEAALGVSVRVQMPAVAKGSAASSAFVMSSNALPDTVWDGITLVGDDRDNEFALRYVADSAVLHTGGAANGSLLPDSIFTEGTLVGCDSLDGVVPAGERCSAWVTFEIRVDQPNFEVAAFAQQGETDAWSETLVAEPGQRITLMATYKNTGTTQQDDVVFTATLPNNMHFVSGTTLWSNARMQDVPATSDAITGVGINVGSYAPGGNVWVTFEVVVDGPFDAANVQDVEDIISVHTNNGSKGAALTLVWL